MRISYFNMVAEFHYKMELPRYQFQMVPQLLDTEDMNFRLKFLEEEMTELKEAYVDEDILGVADALADLVYVALGTAHLMNISFDTVFREVHRANMQKERATGADDPRSTRSHQLDVVKPEDFEPPNIWEAIYGKGRD